MKDGVVCPPPSHPPPPPQKKKKIQPRNIFENCVVAFLGVGDGHRVFHLWVETGSLYTACFTGLGIVTICSKTVIGQCELTLPSLIAGSCLQVVSHEKKLTSTLSTPGNEGFSGRPPDKSAYWKIIFFISHPKHMLWVLKRTVSMIRFFSASITHV